MSRMCVIEGCGRKISARRLCAKHYWHARHDGTVDLFPKITPEDGNLVALLTECGVTYRQLDYWCRKGYISLSQPAQGSGTRRAATARESEAIKRLCAEIADVESRWARVRSGEFFTEAMDDVTLPTSKEQQ